ncbi:LAQU0S25e00276g1_1 [Lachancea quebecensis]|uniref:Long chronological lifespan protein 2 n=1 Tax=Lachancea quebecensis TaxID=1654605 RepID=A0A0P1KYB2_9SACH|nr:LAQU0S25e00276g1_1 [Lachancea quebecensis]
MRGTSFGLYFLLPIASGFFFDFNQRNQHEGQHPQVSYEDKVLNSDCAEFLCPDTLACVKSAKDCPCPFPKSQLRCVLPDSHFVCISKPATHDKNLNAMYDDPVKGPQSKIKGLRDCGWVQDAYKGII